MSLAVFANFQRKFPSRPARKTALTPLRAHEEETPSGVGATCCCCKATTVLFLCNAVTLPIGIVIVVVGAFINNEVRGWEMNSLDIVGYLCLGAGAIIIVLSLLGIAAARSRSSILEFMYFFLVNMVSAALLLLFLQVALEYDQADAILREKWPQIQQVLGTHATLDEARQTMQDYFIVILVIGVVGVGVLIVTQISATRLLGLRRIALSQLIALCVVGAGAACAAGLLSTSLPAATVWLLAGCGCVQVVSSLCGLIGFKRKNRECINILFLILSVSTLAMVYVAVSSYMLIRQGTSQHPDKLLFLFAIAVTAIIFNVYTFTFEALYYYKLRKEFIDRERANQLPVHFSENYLKHRRGRFGQAKRRKPICEYSPSLAL